MTIDAWLQSAIADAERRGLPELKPLLEALAQPSRAAARRRLQRHASSDATPGHESR